MKHRAIEHVIRDVQKVQTSGEVVGQINGLSVVDLGDTAFGRANRITARVRMGTGKVVDIEREVEMGGPLHTKGVLILSGFLGTLAGRRVLNHLSDHGFRRALDVVLILISIRLIWTGAASLLE